MPHILLLEDDETIAFGIERAMKKRAAPLSGAVP